MAVLGDNRPEWLYCHVGIMAAGGRTCGIYATSSPEQVRYLLNHSEARVLFLENEEQLEKALTVLGETRVERVVIWDAKGLWGFADARVTFFDDFRKEGQLYQERTPGGSGSGSRPSSPTTRRWSSTRRGHRAAQGRDAVPPEHPVGGGGALEAVPWTEDEEVVSYLPFAHIFENFTSFFNAIRLGYRRELRGERGHPVPEPARGVADLLRRPAADLGEAGLRGRAADGRLHADQARGLPGRVAVGRRHARAVQAGRVPLGCGSRTPLAYAAALYPLRRRLGFERIRIAVSAAAPAAPEMFEYFHALGIPLAEVYGQTESTGMVSANREGRNRAGTVGEPIAGIEVRLATTARS